jgi:hypothetical protein
MVSATSSFRASVALVISATARSLCITYEPSGEDFQTEVALNTKL